AGSIAAVGPVAARTADAALRTAVGPGAAAAARVTSGSVRIDVGTVIDDHAAGLDVDTAAEPGAAGSAVATRSTIALRQAARAALSPRVSVAAGGGIRLPEGAVVAVPVPGLAVAAAAEAIAADAAVAARSTVADRLGVAATGTARAGIAAR